MEDEIIEVEKKLKEQKDLTKKVEEEKNEISKKSADRELMQGSMFADQ
jgi:hypothetical protein|tara:strand:+ start:225 stop:368 length:144 start_codon:yes stop_codon:yes gene_type:complete